MPFSQGPKVIGLGNFFIRQANAIVLIVKNGIIKFFNEFMSLLMVVNRKELIFSPTTSSFLLQRQGTKGPFFFQGPPSYAFLHCYPKPYYYGSVQYGIGLKRESRLFGILGRRPFTKETNYALATRTRWQIKPEQKKQRTFDIRHYHYKKSHCWQEIFMRARI